MFPTTFKSSKPLVFKNIFTEYIIKNYGSQSVTEQLERFIKTLQDNQNVLSSIKMVNANSASYRSTKEIILKYIEQLLALHTKIPFGNDNMSVKAYFTWSDVLSRENYSSYSYHFELYNTLFNLGVLYYSLGDALERENTQKDENLLKEISNQFQYSLYIFEMLKEEASDKIPKEQLPIDLSPVVLEFYRVLCKIKIQQFLIEIAEQRKKTDALPKLTLGISQLYKQAYQLCSQQPLAKYVENDFKSFLQYSYIYYEAMMIFKLRDKYQVIFDQKGTNYGKVLVYTKKAVEKVTECGTIINKNTKYVNIDNLKRDIAKEQASIKTMEYNQLNIYRAPTVFEQEKVEPMIMAKSKKPDELDLSEENKHCSELDTLIPKEVKELIEKYKEEMNKYITSVISQYENEQKLNDALSSMNLPSAVLDNTDMSYLNTVEISDYLWKQIEDIQQRDGTLGLMNIIGDIERRSFELEKRLRDAMNWLGTEEKEDYFYRNQFGEGKWIREPSNKYNQGFYQGLQGYIMSLNQSRPFDQNQKGDVMESAKYFEMFALTRLELNMRIPGRQNQGEKPTLSLKEEDIKTGLQEIKEMGINCTKIIRNIYSTLNEDSTLVSSFIEVINNQITAEKVLEDNKPKFQPLFEELQKLSSEVHEKVIQLRNMCNALEKNPEVENKKQLLNEQIDAFMNNLQTYINMYNAKFEQLQKGVGYYNNLQNKIHEMLNSVYRYLNKRNEEKIYLIQIITKRQMEPPIPIELLPVIQEEQPKEYPEDDFLDPSKNIITNMNTTYTFGNTFQGKVNMRPMPANYQNNNYNQFPNNNNFPQQNYPNNGYYK